MASCGKPSPFQHVNADSKGTSLLSTSKIWGGNAEVGASKTPSRVEIVLSKPTLFLLLNPKLLWVIYLDRHQLHIWRTCSMSKLLHSKGAGTQCALILPVKLRPPATDD
eukprot:scaffold33510_cov18-Tisochrysis_lutea.AAC.2